MASKAAFDAVMALDAVPPAQRQQRLDAMGLPPDVKSEAQRLLHVWAEAGDSFLETPPALHESSVAPTAAGADVAVTADPNSSTLPPPAHAGAATDDLAGYVKIGLIGEGGMGVVWKAEQLGTKRIVALKTISASFIGSERVRLRFEREVELAANLEHPFIARIYDSGLSRGVCFCAMELVEGISLTKYATHNKLGPREKVELMLRVCQGVRYAHEHGVIHRDLKPSNILVTADGTPKLLDFGVAKGIGQIASDMDSRITLSGDVVGTPSYMSPEQARGEGASADTRGDVWGLGSILFELLTGALPFETGDGYVNVIRRVAEEEPRRPRTMRPDLNAELESILLKCLTRDPAGRYATAGELADDLKRFLEGEPLAARRATTLYFVRKRIARYKARFALAALVLLALAGGAVFYVFSIRAERDRTLAAKLVADSKTELAVQEATQAALQRSVALETIRSFILTAQQELSRNTADAKLRESLLGIARGGLEKIAAASDESLTTSRELAAATVVMGDIAAAAGDLARARALYADAVARYEKATDVPAREPVVARMRLARALLDLGESAAATEEFAKAGRVLEPLIKANPADTNLRRDGMTLLISQGDALMGKARHQEALHFYQDALAMAAAGVPDDRATVQRRIAAAWEARVGASGKAGNAGDRESALREADAAATLDRARLAAERDTLAAQRDFALSLLRCARLRRPSGGRAEAQEAYNILSRHAGEDAALPALLDAGEALLVLIRTFDAPPQDLVVAARGFLTRVKKHDTPQSPALAARLAGLRAELAAIPGV